MCKYLDRRICSGYFFCGFFVNNRKTAGVKDPGSIGYPSEAASEDAACDGYPDGISK
jgi:hypothetical protein